MATTEHWATSLIRDFETKNPPFYGKVTLEFRKGEVVLIREESTHLPPNGKTEGDTR